MVQILPASDLFAAGSPAYGSAGVGFLPLYLGAKHAHTSTVSLWQPSGRLFIARPMHGGYQTTDSNGIHDYNAAFHDAGTGTAAHADSLAPSGMMFRAPFGADVIATASFEMRALLGSAGIADLAPRGVFARAQAGTLSGDGTSDPEIRDGSCYFAALYRKASDSTLRFGIGKFVAGVLTVISESIAIPTGTVVWTALGTITLSVTGTALFATLTGMGSATVLRQPTSGTVTDSSVAGAGRVGFFMGADREPAAGRKQVDLCHLLAVDEGGTRQLQDEFRRLQLGAAKQTTADAVGTPGSGYLSSAFYWDAGTLSGPRLRRNATAGRVEFDHQVTDDDSNAGRLVLAQRPASNQFSQHRSVAIVIPSAPALATGEVWAGISLRSYQAQPVDDATPAIPVTGSTPNFPGGVGYLFVLRARAATGTSGADYMVRWQLHRMTLAGHQVIATLSEYTAGVFPGYAAQFTMEFECFPRVEADPFGPVQLVCKVNGSALDMALGSVPASIIRLSAGNFLDGSLGRVQSGFGEGLVLANGLARTGTASADIDPNFEAWTQLALTNVAVLDEDQASVVLVTEGAAVGGAPCIPDMPFKVRTRAYSISNPFDSGHRQSMPLHNGRRDKLYRFTKQGLRRTDLDTLIAHWDSHGISVPWNFTQPGESVVKVHYVRDSLRYSMDIAGAWDVEFEAESFL